MIMCQKSTAFSTDVTSSLSLSLSPPTPSILLEERAWDWDYLLPQYTTTITVAAVVVAQKQFY